MAGIFDFDVDLFYDGDYYAISAVLYKEGVYKVLTDGAGQEFYEIEDEPVFDELEIYDPDGEHMDNPDDKLAIAAIEMLKEVYWQLELD